MHKQRRSIGKFLSAMLIASSLSSAATLSLTAKYANSGNGNSGSKEGLPSYFNRDGDKVNSIVICDGVNDNTNEVPGCDMSADVGYNNNGTSSDPTDDYYTGDLIVRTNDTFDVAASFSWSGSPNEDDLTLTGTLPAGIGFIWNNLPDDCKEGSSISDDRKTLVCKLPNFAGDRSSVSGLVLLTARVEGDAENGSKPGDIMLKLEAPNAQPVEDGVKDGRDENLLIVTAAPRWDLQLTTLTGLKKNNQDENGEKGWYLYLMHILTSGRAGTTDMPEPWLGNEALADHNDSSYSFTLDLSEMTPNTKLVTWDNDNRFDPTDNPCDIDSFTNAYYPFPHLIEGKEPQSMPYKEGVPKVTCSQSGDDVAINVTHIDGRLTDAPAYNSYSPTAYNSARRYASFGIVKVFIPYSDVPDEGPDGVLGTEDDYTLNVKAKLKDLQIQTQSGRDNFLGASSDGEYLGDNELTIKLQTMKEYFTKRFVRGWLGSQPDWNKYLVDASYWRRGDGVMTHEGEFGTQIYYRNDGILDIDNIVTCDVIDTNIYTMEFSAAEDDPNTDLNETEHAIALLRTSGAVMGDVSIEYGVGYVGEWPPNPDNASDNDDALLRECNTTDNWYPTLSEAKAAAQNAGTYVTKVRVSVPKLTSGQVLGYVIHQKIRKNFADSGDFIPNDTILANYATVKSSFSKGKFKHNNYVPYTTQAKNHGGGAGDRIIIQKSRARHQLSIIDDDQKVTSGDEFNLTIKPSFTIDGPEMFTDNTRLAALLPKGFIYKAETSSGTYGAGTPYGEPVMIIVNATDSDCQEYASEMVAEGAPCGSANGGTGKETILVWNIGSLETNTPMGDLNFTVTTGIDAADGWNNFYSQYTADSDEALAKKHVRKDKIKNVVYQTLMAGKNVLTPLHEINKGSLEDWMRFDVGVRNGFGNPLEDLDIIDILPYNGDATVKFSTAADGTAERDPATSFEGNLTLAAVDVDDNGGECGIDDIEYWYTNKAPDELDLDPTSTDNTDADGNVVTATWCQGDSNGPDASCGFDMNAVTAVRARNIDMAAKGTCYMHLTLATRDNGNNNTYTNNAAATAKLSDGTQFQSVLTNTVSARVYASSVSGMVWHDSNNNGIRDNGEEGLGQVALSLLDSNDNVVANTLSGSDGSYAFVNLIHGDYTIVIDPGQRVLSPVDQGDDSVDSDFDPQTRKVSVSLDEGEEIAHVDAGLNAAPLAVDDNVTIDEDHNLSGSVADNDTASADGGNKWEVTTPPAHGSVTMDDTGNFTYTPDENYFGEDSFVYTITDADGDQASATVRITINSVNDTPVANDDAVQTNEDTNVTIDVLANDEDPEGLDPATLTITQQPAHGTLTLNADGTVTYTPEANFNGTDTFKYTVSDTDGAVSNEAMVTITVDAVNDAPEAVDDSATTDEDQAVEIDVLANDSDADGSLNPASVTIVKQPEHGTLSVDPQTGKVTYTPNPDYHGTDSFSYTVEDDGGQVSEPATVSLTINDINDAPVANDDMVHTDEDTPVDINVTANDTDADGTVDASTVTIVADPSHGTVTINADGTVRYTPETNYHGDDQFTYTVKDDDGALSNVATVYVTMEDVNDAPVAGDDSASTNEDSAVTIDLLANDSDVDGTVDPATVSIVNQPEHGTVSIDPQTGKVTYTPNADYHGTDSFTYDVKDDDGLVSNVATVTVSIADVNDAPIANDDVATVDEDGSIDINVTANDIDRDGMIDPKEVNITKQPEHGTLSVDPQTGVVTYTPDPDYNGPDSFSYTVKDDDGTVSNEAEVSISVKSVNDAPVANDDNVSMDEDTNVTIDVLANDEDKDGTIDPTTVRIVKQPEHGTVTVDPQTGEVTYTPDPDYFGEDSFSYVVEDESGAVSNEGTVHLSIADVPDTVNIKAFIWVDKNGNKEYDANEEKLAGTTVELLDSEGNPLKSSVGTGKSVQGRYVGVTDENGTFLFEDVPFGKYLLRFTLSQSAIDEGYSFGDGEASTTQPVDANVSSNTHQVQVVLSAVRVQCGCDSDKVGGDGGSAMGRAWGLLMVLLTMGLGWLAVRRREEEMMMRKEER